MIEILMKHLKEQHTLRLEEDCSAGEIEESFSILKNKICNELYNDRYRDSRVLAQIQNA